MSGCARLYRLVTSTLADGTPAGTGRLSASTSSTMHMSVLNTSTLSPGALAPTSPSVEPKVSTTGAWKTSLIAARVSGSSVSPIAVTAGGALFGRQASQHRGVPVHDGRLQRVQPLHDLGQRQGDRDRQELKRHAGSCERRPKAGAVDDQHSGDHGDSQSTWWRATRCVEPGQILPCQRRGVPDQRGTVEDVH